MNRLRKIAEIPAGSWTKWVVVGVWVVVLVIAFPLSSKLTGAEKNDASAWLPGGAESTKVLNVQSQFQSPNVYPGVGVYERASGLTDADRATAAADGRAALACGISGDGRRLHNLSLAETGHSIRLLVDIDANINTFAGIRDALRCHGMCLSRECYSEFLKGFSHFFCHPRPTLER